MEIREMDFDNYGEVDCKARMRTVNVKATGVLPLFSLSIRRTGKGEYQAYAKFTQAPIYVQSENGQTLSVEEIVLKEGSLVDVVSFTNSLTGGKDTVSRARDRPAVVQTTEKKPEEPKSG